MARACVKNTSNYISLAVNAFGAKFNGSAVISWHAWVKPSTLSTGGNDNYIFSCFINNAGSALAGVVAQFHYNGSNHVLRCGGRSNGTTDTFQSQSSSATFSTGTWYAVGGIHNVGGDTITPYVNGASSGGGAVTFNSTTYTNSAHATQVDQIGCNASVPIGATANMLAGDIAELAFWYGTRALTAGEFTALGNGVSPKLVGAGLSRLYYPLIGIASPEQELFQGVTATINGTVAAAAHPRIYYPSAQILQFPSAAAAPGGLAANPIYGGGAAALPLRGYIAA